MRSKAEIPVQLLRGKGADALIEAYFEFSHLKQLYRQGWLARGIPPERCESVAEHTFGVALLAYWLAEAYFPDLDAGRVIRLALLHDLGEIYAGDFTPADRIPNEDKHALERRSVERVFSRLPNGETYLRLWEEYETQASQEARFIKQIDRLEMALQALVYEHQGYPEMQDFFDSAARGISTAELQAIMQAIRSLRADDRARDPGYQEPDPGQ